MNFDAALEENLQEEIKEEKNVVSVDPFDPVPLIKKFDEFRGLIAVMIEKANGHSVNDDLTNQTAVTMTTQAKKLAKAIEDKRVELKAPYLQITSILDGETKTLKDGLANVQTILNGKITPYLQKKEQERQESERKAREEAARIQRELEAEARKKAEEEARIRYEAEKAERERIALERQKAMDEKQAEMDRIRAIEEEKRLQEESARQAETEARKAVSMVPEIVTSIPDEIKTITTSGSADLKKEWAWEIFDFKAIPDEAYHARSKELTSALTPYLNAQIKAGIRNIPGVRVFEKATLKTRAK